MLSRQRMTTVNSEQDSPRHAPMFYRRGHCQRGGQAAVILPRKRLLAKACAVRSVESWGGGGRLSVRLLVRLQPQRAKCETAPATRGVSIAQGSL